MTNHTTDRMPVTVAHTAIFIQIKLRYCSAVWIPATVDGGLVFLFHVGFVYLVCMLYRDLMFLRWSEKQQQIHERGEQERDIHKKA